MVKVSFSGTHLILEVEGLDVLWSLKGSLSIPIAHVSEVTVDPPAVHDWWKGVRWGGTMVPGVITAGTFFYHGDRVFWDVHDPDRAVGISLHDEQYKELIIEVESPYEVAELVQAAIDQTN